MKNKWSKMNSPGKKDLASSVQGRWKISTFFFFLISFHSLLLPWLPFILRLSGLDFYGIAIVMFLVAVSAVLGVKFILTLITITRSGALRRLVLFVMLSLSLILYASSVSFLSEDNRNWTCTNKIDVSSIMNNYSTDYNDAQITTTPESVFNITSTPSTNATISSTSTSGLPNYTDYVQTDNFSLTTFFTSEEVTTTSIPEIINSSSSSLDAASSGSTEFSSTSKENDSTTNPPTVSVPNQTSTVNIDQNDSVSENDGKVSSVAYEFSNSAEENYGPSLSTSENAANSELEEVTSESFTEYETTKKPRGNKRPSTTNIHKPKLPSQRQYLNNILNEQRFRQEHINSYSNLNRNEQYPYHRRFGKKLSRPNISYKEKLHNMRDNYINYFYPDEQGSYPDAENIYDDKFEVIPYRSRTKRGVQSKQLHISPVNISTSTMKPTLPMISKPYNYESNGKSWILVPLFVILASFFGSGIEAGVTRLWHCYSHGYHLFHNSPRYDLGGDDLLERTLTDTFELSATGEHYGWARVVAGITILSSPIILELGCQIGIPPGWSLMGQVGLFVTGGFLTVLWLAFILPIPYGSIKSPKAPRPLSLYLDDEVLWEGLRRIASPTGTAVHGLFCSLPKAYVVIILLELAEASNWNSDFLVAMGVSSSIFGEGITICYRKCIAKALDPPGLVSLALGLLAIQMIATWWMMNGAGLWFASLTWIVVGVSQGLSLISVRQNALMLATISDQEREAWVSWGSGQLGHAIGVLLWPIVAKSRWDDSSMANLMMPVGICSSVLSVIVFIFALVTRSRRSARRRVYHTLDLHSVGEDDSSDEDEDWLVKGAKREGVNLN